ncbi:MAG: hypothetical protein FWD05_09110 [Oscillospiraceae bacterium]|nr:hypothetical protein [Oscillospiraceae bacterium]
MSAVKIINNVPLFGSTLLLVVESLETRMKDVVLVNLPVENALTSEYIENLEQTLPFTNDIKSSDKSEDVTIEVESELYDKIKKWCTQLGISLEQLAIAFIRFCVCVDNHTILREWFNSNRILDELDLTAAELK